MLYRVIIFLALNFAALAIGGFWARGGSSSAWYQGLAKAPWTPPGWVFGSAWALIMICFAFYMASAWKSVANYKMLLILFIVQWILNIMWNPTFFNFHLVLPGLIIISLLTILVFYFFFNYYSSLKGISFLLLPYMIWLLIATSLNAYILFNN